MTLCVAQGLILRYLEDVFVPLDRLGTHPVECNFGTARAAMGGSLSYTAWLAAEVFAIMLPREAEDAGLRLRGRRGRTSVAGADAAPVAQEDTLHLIGASDWNRAVLLDAARGFQAGDPNAQASLGEWLQDLADRLTTRATAVVPQQSPTAGYRANAHRRFGPNKL
jgi:hypothetical protein